MGKASRRRSAADSPGHHSGRERKASEPVPFARRPFEGLPGETEWVAMREILPAATGTVRLTDGPAPQDGVREVTAATVLPMAWPALHRSDGTAFIGIQSGASSGDASRDLAQSLLAVCRTEPGVPVTAVEQPTAQTPRLQDLIDVTEPFTVQVHDGFDFWVAGQELDAEAQESLDRANASVVPTVKLGAAASAYWCRIGQRTHLRLILGDDEDAATDALARLHATDRSGLGAATRLLGAFRACGLLVPVWDLDPGKEAADYEQELRDFVERYVAALGSSEPLTPQERRARSGLLSRQVTLR